MRSLLFFLLAALPVMADDWPQWLGPKRDSVWRETGIAEKFPADAKPLWSVKLAGGFGGPAVVDGKVYVADYTTTGDVQKETFDRTDFKGQEALHCFDATTGKAIWKFQYDCNYTVSYPTGPRCTPTVSDGKVYFLGTEGDFHCIDAAKGTALWSKNFKKEYGTKSAIWGYASHPLVVGSTVYCVVGGEGSCVVAFDAATGKERWKALTAEEQGYSPPTLIDAGGTKQLIVWHATSVNSLDPETGKKFWSVRLQTEYKNSIMTPRQLGDFLYVAGEGEVGVLLKLAADKPDVTEVWRGKKNMGLYPINMTPFLEDGHMYGVDQSGHLRCVEVATGKRVWESADPFDGKANPFATAFIVKNEGRFLLFTEKGDLISAKLSPKGYEEQSRMKVITPTTTASGRKVVWTHPAFANGCIFARSDRELVCVKLAK